MFGRNSITIPAKMLAYDWIQTQFNLYDMLSKHWDHPSVPPPPPLLIMKPLITRGNITLIPREATEEKEKKLSEKSDN